MTTTRKASAPDDALPPMAQRLADGIKELERMTADAESATRASAILAPIAMPLTALRANKDLTGWSEAEVSAIEALGDQVWEDWWTLTRKVTHALGAASVDLETGNARAEVISTQFSPAMSAFLIDEDWFPGLKALADEAVACWREASVKLAKARAVKPGVVKSGGGGTRAPKLNGHWKMRAFCEHEGCKDPVVSRSGDEYKQALNSCRDAVLAHYSTHHAGDKPRKGDKRWQGIDEAIRALWGPALDADRAGWTQPAATQGVSFVFSLPSAPVDRMPTTGATEAA